MVYWVGDTGTIGTGSFASVIKVKESHVHKVFAAKVPHLYGSKKDSEKGQMLARSSLGGNHI